LETRRDMPPGEYRLVAGLYDSATGQRLSTDAGGDAIELGNLDIAQAAESVP
jgi:hypothetical protein